MFKRLSVRLILSYLGVTIAIFATSLLVAYQFIRYNFYGKLDRQLITLADAAAHSLPIIKSNPQKVNNPQERVIDDDGDLDIPWQDLMENRQGIEWFDPDGKLLGKAGKYFTDIPFTPHFKVKQTPGIRSLIIPVYEKINATIITELVPLEENLLIGYIRVSESTNQIEEELDRIIISLGGGGLIAIILSSVAAWWLTNQSLEPIKQSFAQLKQFTADASHELRSPLTVIKTSVEVMQSHPERIHPNNVKKLASIVSATNQITHLVEDLLTLARIESRPIELSHQLPSLPLEEILEDLVDLYTDMALEKQINLSLITNGSPWIKGDVNQLQRIFTNLIENALQYTPNHGKISIQLTSLEKSVIITIQDTGIGIAPAHLPHIFQRFWRADEARNRREGGTGLGLAIVEGLIQTHGGEITVKSQLGIGTTFSIRFPRVPGKNF